MAEFNFPRIEEKFIPIFEQFIKKSCDESSIKESEKNFRRKLEEMDNNELLSCFTHNYEQIAKKLGWYDNKLKKSINIYKSIAHLLIDSRNAINHRVVRKGIEKEILEKSIIYNALLFINAIRKTFTSTDENKMVDDFVNYLNDILADTNDPGNDLRKRIKELEKELAEMQNTKIEKPENKKKTERKSQSVIIRKSDNLVKKGFIKWMTRYDKRKKEKTTAAQYASFIDSISAHYSEQIEKKIDLYTVTDISLIKKLVNNYDTNGKYGEFGEKGPGGKGKGHIRNAIKAYARFLECENGSITPLDSNKTKQVKAQNNTKTTIENVKHGVLTQGDIINNKELYEIFHCALQGGMRRSKATNTLLLIENKNNSTYQDEWKTEIIHYTGMGTVGDQSFDYSQNKTLYDSTKNGVTVLYFEVTKPKEYTFFGRVELAGEPYTENQRDQNGEMRKVCKFPLKVVKEEYEY